MPACIPRSASGALIVPHLHARARSLQSVLIREWLDSLAGSEAQAVAVADILALAAAHPDLGTVEQWRRNLGVAP